MSRALSISLVALSASMGVTLGAAAHLWGPLALPVGESTTAAAPSSAPAAPDSATPIASASASVGPTPTEMATCLRPLFPDDTFPDGDDSIALVCEEVSVVRGSARVKELLVRSGKKRTTGGMKEWAVLGFYELAAYATLRAHCCPAEPKLEVPAPPDNCDPLTASLDSIVAASKSTAAEAQVDVAVLEYRKAAACIVRNRFGEQFGGYPAPRGGEGTTFKKLVTRTRKAP